MSILTLKHCIFCYKEESPISANKFSNANTEVCRRFCTLASRHLHLNPINFRPGKSLKSELSMNLENVCDECMEIASSFCDMFVHVENLKMQMDWRILEMCKVMGEADKDDSPHSNYRQMLVQKVEKVGRTMKEIDDFRKDFSAAATRRGKSSAPRLCISEISEDEDSDSESNFTPVKRSQPKAKRNQSPPESDESLFALKTKQEKRDVNELSEKPICSRRISASFHQPTSKGKKRSRNEPSLSVDHATDQLEPAFLADDGETAGSKRKRIIVTQNASSNNNDNDADAMVTNARLKCEKCPKSFAFKGTLHSHQEAIHDASIYTCPYCKTICKYRKSFQIHLKRSTRTCRRLRPLDFDYKLFNIDDCKKTTDAV